MAGQEIARGHAIASLVLGALEIVFGLIIIICSFVLGGKINASARLTPYWAGIPVSPLLLFMFILTSLSVFLKIVGHLNCLPNICNLLELI